MTSVRSKADNHFATALSVVAGFVDAAGFIILVGVFTAQISGTVTTLGVAIAEQHWGEALRRAFIVPVFIVGTVLALALLRHDAIRRARSPIAILLLLEAALLGTFTLVVFTGSGSETLSSGAPYYLSAALAALAMGLQNGAFRHVGKLSVHTTYITGAITDGVVGMFEYIDARRIKPRDFDAIATARQRMTINAVIGSCYLAGATLGAFLILKFGDVSVVVCVIALVALAAIDWRVKRPINP